MKSLLILIVVAMTLPTSSQARPREVFKIEIGGDYEKYSNRELKQRVWKLERAVFQLQEQVFQLAMEKQRPGQGYDTGMWTCHIQSFGKTFTSTKSSKGAAKADVLRDCSNNSNSIHCKSDDVSCEQ